MNECNLWFSKIWPINTRDSIDNIYFCYYWSYFLVIHFGPPWIYIARQWDVSYKFCMWYCSAPKSWSTTPSFYSISPHHARPFLATHTVTSLDQKTINLLLISGPGKNWLYCALNTLKKFLCCDLTFLTYWFLLIFIYL